MRPPNILFLLSDEHSFRFFSHLKEEDGGEPVATPHLDKLKAQSVKFNNTYCQMALCTPSRLCLLSGKHVRGAGAWTNDSTLSPDLVTLPAILRKAGYETCLVGKMHLGGSRQFVGFQHRPYGDLTGGTGHQGQEVPEGYDGTKYSWRLDGAGELEYPESALQEQVTAQETIAWIREHCSSKPDTPWFTLASFSRPHFPLTAPDRWINKYPPDAITEPKAPAAGDSFGHPMTTALRKGFEVDQLTQEEQQRMRAGYFACVSYLDEILGDLLTRLDLSGDLENTVIVYASDHGEMAGEHGSWWKHTFHEASTRVPMMISLPEHRTGELPAQQIETPVELIDLYPTLCSLAGGDSSESEGRDLSPNLTNGQEPEVIPVVSDNLIPRWGEGTEYRMVRYGDYKYVGFRDGTEFLFDLRNDPLEQKDLSKGELNEAIVPTLELLRTYVADTMDFEAAEKERIEGTADLAQRFPKTTAPSQGNLYHLKDGRIINGEDAVYNPTVVADSAAEAFGDDWQEQNQPD
ncbi:MAG: sulfatase-like hydrolase/transferase [Verrucomicrobia bacterium]|nr:sulfatase-like hydrolase/transferase [Verrucomicrobiota bacterium]